MLEPNNGRAMVTPLCATEQWKPPKTHINTVSTSGGFSKDVFVLSTIEVIGTDPTTGKHGTLRFVDVAKNKKWFLKMVGGDQCLKGECKHVKVFDMLANTVKASLGPAAADEPDPPQPDAPDPMEALDAPAPAKPVTPKKRAPARKQKQKVSCVTVPLHPQCADASCKNTVQVCVYYGGKTAQKTYLGLDAIPWLVAYAADELHFQGVVCSDDEDVKECNCAAVAGLHVEWDFNRAGYDGEFVDGPHVGTKRSFSVGEHTEERWTKMICASIVSKEHVFPNVTTATKKAAAKELVVRWCASIAEGSETDFARDWDLSGGTLPPHSVAEANSAVAESPPNY